MTTLVTISALICATATTPVRKNLTTIADVNAVIDDGMRQRCYFTVTGTVVHVHKRSFIVDDGQERLALFSNVFEPPRTGDVVRVGGWTRDNGDRWNAIAHSDCRVIGHAPLPPRKDVSFADVAAGKCNLQDVRIAGCTIEGVYRDEIDPGWNLLVLREGAETIFAHIPEKGDSRLDLIKNLVGARIRISGLCYNCMSGLRRHIGVSITLLSRRAIEVLVPPPDDPFDLPRIDNFYSATPQSIAALGRRKVEGRVIACWHGDRFLLRTDVGDVMRIDLAEGETCPQAGESAEVVGKPETDLFRLNFTQARVRTASGAKADAESPVETTAAGILTNDRGESRVDPRWFGRIVRLEGIVRTQPTDDAGIFHLDCNGITIAVDATALGRDFPTPSINSEVAVTGACLFEYGAWRQSAPLTHAEGISLIVRTPDDVQILRTPSPLTVGRLCAALGAVLVLLFGFAWWNRLLAVRAERRGRELAAERLAHAKANVKVEERTRLAVELHDSISQTLTGIALQVDSALSSGTIADSRIRRFLSTARLMLDSCRKELQNCLWDLRSRTFEEKDMTEAVLRTIRPHLGTIAASVRFNVPRANLSEQTAHTILRIVRELTVNAIRHGHATRIRIAGELKDGVIHFSVRDDGDGFDVSAVRGPAEGHFGLQGIRERLIGFDGSLGVESLPGHGSSFRITMNTNASELT